MSVEASQHVASTDMPAVDPEFASSGSPSNAMEPTKVDTSVPEGTASTAAASQVVSSTGQTTDTAESQPPIVDSTPEGAVKIEASPLNFGYLGYKAPGFIKYALFLAPEPTHAPSNRLAKENPFTQVTPLFEQVFLAW